MSEGGTVVEHIWGTLISRLVHVICCKTSKKLFIVDLLGQFIKR